MAKTIAALYKQVATAELVVNALIEAGFSGDDISLLVRETNNDTSKAMMKDVTPPEGVGFGAMIGALVGICTFLLPGVGPLLGVGPLAVALSAGIGAAAGAVTGGMTAGLLDLGIDEEEALFLTEGVRRGGTLVSLTTQEQWIEWAENIMKRYEPLSLEEHVVEERTMPSTTFTSASVEKKPSFDAPMAALKLQRYASKREGQPRRAQSYDTDYQI